MSPSLWPQAMSGFSDALMATWQTNPPPLEMLDSASCLHVLYLVNTRHHHGFRSRINNLFPNLPHLCTCSLKKFGNCVFAFKYHAAPLAFHCLNVSCLEDDIVWWHVDQGRACMVRMRKAMGCPACLTSPAVQAGSGLGNFFSMDVEIWVQA